jgi:hypothetical protein
VVAQSHVDDCQAFAVTDATGYMLDFGACRPCQENTDGSRSLRIATRLIAWGCDCRLAVNRTAGGG